MEAFLFLFLYGPTKTGRLFTRFALPILIVLCPIQAGCSHGRTPAGEGKFTKVGDRFFRGSDGRLFVKTRGLTAELKPGPEFYREVPPIDVGTYRVLGWYSLDSRRVYVENEMTDGLSIFELDDADPKTFVVFGYRWGRDARHVWHNGLVLHGLDPEKMIVVSGQDLKFFDYVRDHSRVFFGHQEIVGADAASFTCRKDPLDPSRVIASDKNFTWNTNEWTAGSGFSRTPK